ncbi:hypothetical protein ACEQ8H_005632 [Pleosporales sp. CAS-2024a]
MAAFLLEAGVVVAESKRKEAFHVESEELFWNTVQDGNVILVADGAKRREEEDLDNTDDDDGDEVFEMTHDAVGSESLDGHVSSQTSSATMSTHGSVLIPGADAMHMLAASSASPKTEPSHLLASPNSLVHVLFVVLAVLLVVLPGSY